MIILLVITSVALSVELAVDVHVVNSKLKFMPKGSCDLQCQCWYNQNSSIANFRDSFRKTECGYSYKIIIKQNQNFIMNV